MNNSAVIVIRQGIAGACGSLLMFVVMEPFMRSSELNRAAGNAADAATGAVTTLLAGALLGAFLAGALTFTEELGTGRAARIAGRSLLAALAGFVIGMISIVAGAVLFAVLSVSGTLMLGRSLGWSLLGAGLGLAGGVVTLSFAKIKQGVLGGAIGGLLGGFVLDLLPAFGDAATLSRFVGFTSMGVCIGLAIAFVQEVARRAWVTVLTGRGEGKRFLVNKPRFTIGRAELADIPLYGDPSVDRTQAVLEQTGRGYAIQDVGQHPLLCVNGEPTRSASLSDGSVVQIAGHRLRFSVRGASDASRIQFYVPQPAPGAPLWVEPGDTAAVAEPCSAPAYAEAAHEDTELQAIALVAESGPHSGANFPVAPFGSQVGRSPDCDICLGRDGVVSRLHAEFFPESTGWVIRDSGSRNGLTVNGEHVEEAWVYPGDLIGIGSGTYRVVALA